MLDIQTEIELLESTYYDTATIKRKTQYIEDCETKFKIDTIYSSISCALSKKELQKNSQTDSYNNIDYQSVLFINPKYKIQQGDTIEVTNALGDVLEFTAGEPFRYVTHQEILLQRKDKA